MSDIEALAQALETGLPGTAVAISGLWAAKKVLGPSFDAVGNYAGEATQTRLENLGKIFARAEKLNPNPDVYPHVRTAYKVLNDASLYDDDLMQTYVAGLVAGSRNADGSDDRPIFYLSLMDGLTATQLRFFHMMYAGLRQHGPTQSDRLDPIVNRISMSVADVNAGLAAFNDTSDIDYGSEILIELEHMGLLGSVAYGPGDDGDWRVSYSGTRIGVLLYRWAHGMPTQDVKTFFADAMPDIGIQVPVFSSLRPA